MSNPTAHPTIKDQPFQLFVFGRYVERECEALTQWQKDVLAKVRKFHGNIAAASRALGITPTKGHSIIQSVKNKGWKV